ncbi:MAG: class I SAM-dependent methyltransferase [Candidatus Omnitrophica bacterium]|nr:class I SAM-dependent methyltransferase [Candidatus Omnitrophota bacterium]
MEDLIRSNHCLERLKSCIHLEGDVAECGVAFGQTTFILDGIVRIAGKRLLAFDTFSGLPYDDSIVSNYQCKRGEMDYGKQFFDKFNSLKETSIIPVKGLIEDTLKGYSDRKFCFVWLDMDLYQPTSYAYRFFEDRITKGGIIGFHDYKFHRCPGIEIVVDKEVDKDKYEIIDNVSSCLFIRRK